MKMDNEDILGLFIIFFVLAGIALIYFRNFEEFQLKCIVSTVDGNKYCVRERSQVQNAVDLLATVTKKCKQLVAYMNDKYPDEERVKRLVDGFNPKKIMETLPTSQFTAYSENKGEKIAFCLSKLTSISLFFLSLLTVISLLVYFDSVSIIKASNFCNSLGRFCKKPAGSPIRSRWSSQAASLGWKSSCCGSPRRGNRWERSGCLKLDAASRCRSARRTRPRH